MRASVELTMQSIQTNALSVIALLTRIANRFEQQKKGTIAVISSVAGAWATKQLCIRQCQSHGHILYLRIEAAGFQIGSAGCNDQTRVCRHTYDGRYPKRIAVGLSGRRSRIHCEGMRPKEWRGLCPGFLVGNHQNSQIYSRICI